MAQGQQRGKVYRVGCIPGGPLAPRMHQWDAFRKSLRDLGWIEGKNIALEFRAPEREGGAYDALAADLVRSKVDALVVTGNRATLAAKKLSSTIPIVVTATSNPVGDGLIASLARPGGNVTGLSVMALDLSGKRLEILKDIVPAAKRLVALTAPGTEPELKALRTAAQNARLSVSDFHVANAADLGAAFDLVRREKPDAVYVCNATTFFGLRAEVAELAIKHRVPAIYGLPSYANSGGLVSYGPSDTENYARAAVLLDKILRGANPGELPFEQPTKIELVLNLKSAKAASIVIPRALLLRADHVIE